MALTGFDMLKKLAEDKKADGSPRFSDAELKETVPFLLMCIATHSTDISSLPNNVQQGLKKINKKYALPPTPTQAQYRQCFEENASGMLPPAKILKEFYASFPKLKKVLESAKSPKKPAKASKPAAPSAVVKGADLIRQRSGKISIR